MYPAWEAFISFCPKARILPKQSKKRFLLTSSTLHRHFAAGCNTFSNSKKSKTMFQLFIAMVMALACPNHNHTTTVRTNSEATADTGGETGHIPPKPPTNPPGN
ncbi:hypothetical protein DXN05_21745 [Deminuibacter soli]|uniref:Uncharacterized protein n=2 Tax=Deminuibacter soli TaxID=2291815 RepID=A0A3E1NEE8_9BACT|nr:hypothetical protein DXN05_21745 [Deminuibacter soli]